MPRTFVDYLVDQEAVDRQAAEAARGAADDFREAIGALALRLGVIELNQIEGALKESDRTIPFDDFIVERGYVRQSDLDNLLTVQAMENAMKIGGYLLYHEKISRELFLEKFREFFTESDQPVESHR